MEKTKNLGRKRSRDTLEELEDRHTSMHACHRRRHDGDQDVAQVSAQPSRETTPQRSSREMTPQPSHEMTPQPSCEMTPQPSCQTTPQRSSETSSDSKSEHEKDHPPGCN